MSVFSCAEPERDHFARVVVYRPPKPNLMPFIVITPPHFVHFDPDGTGRTGLEVFHVHLAYEGILVFSAAVTVSLWMPRQREIARVPFPFTDNFMMDD